MKRFYYWRMIFVFLAVMTSRSVLATPPGQPVLQVLDGSLNQLQKDSLVIVQDSAFFFLSGSLNSTTYPVINNVTFKINESSLQYLQSAFTASVRLHITSTLFDNSTVSVDTTLTINYRPDSIYTNRSTYHFKNAYKVEAKVLSVSTNVGWNVWQSLVVENQLQSFTDFSFSCSAQAIQSVSHAALSFATNADELPVSWGNVLQADAYDLEWTYVDTTALISGNYGSPTSPTASLIFDNSATRVTITGTQYNIPLLYDGSGSLFFRVRPVQYKSGGLRAGAQWSSDFAGGLGRFDFYGHERRLNWQSTISFAEEGKRKVVVQYYDGSLRSRQTVTKDNSTNTTVVAESIYDYQGRAAIQVLPAPTLSNIVGYSVNFNVGGINGLAYDQLSFDTMIDSSYYCSARADSMRSSSSGASMYYSAQNPLLDSSFNKYIPDAKGYPFTETVYTQDNTGRISAQSGVGPNHQLHGGHETQYFYGTPDQKELDGLFGTDVGDHSHYFKTMVRDANGQYSVSYADMHGRTIATALAGILPDSIKLDSLKERTRISIIETLSDSTSTVIKDLVMESKKSLLVSLADSNIFTYTLNPQSLQKNDCNNTPVCYDCLYDLEITITDDCNNQKLPGGVPFDTIFHNFSLTIDTTCLNPAAGFSKTFTKYLPEGNYEITKKLSVSRAAINYYRDSVFLKRNTCQTLASTIAQQKAIQAMVTQCKPSCQSCNDSLGTFTTFQQRYMLNAGIAIADSAGYRGAALTAYGQAQADCKLLCGTVSETDDIQNSMLMDMTAPSGQYANLDSAYDHYSIFYTRYDPTTDTAISLPRYSQISGYVDGEGKLDSVYDEVTGAVVPPEQLSPEAFAAKFKASWAQALLPFHPEYCKLQKYLQWSASNDWNKRFETTDTYAQALVKGYLNPLAITGATYTRFNGTVGSIDADPLPSLITSTSSGFLSVFQNEMKDFSDVGVSTPINVSSSIWTMASAPVKYGPRGTATYTIARMSTDSAFTSMCTGDLDMAWRNFRQMYLDVKRHMTDSILNSAVCAVSDSASSAILIARYHYPNFSDVKQSVANYNMYIPVSGADGTTAQQKAKSAASSSYNSNCASYATYWYQQLKSSCSVYTYTSTDSAAIIPLLIQVCQKGSNATHPYGSSSISPDSTNTYNSFQSVIQTYNTAHSITDVYCNSYGITSPKPYNGQASYGNQALYGRPDTCTCNKLTALNNQYLLQAAYYGSFANYLSVVYNTTISSTDLSTLMSSCALVSAPECTYSASPIQLPPLFQCGVGDVCITCPQYKTYTNSFATLYPGISAVADSLTTDSSQMAKNKLFAAYMNSQFGFVKNSNDYLQFGGLCTVKQAADSAYLNQDTCKSFSFIKNYGGTGVDLLADVRQTFDGGYILAGNTSSFGNGNTDGYIIKTDNKGNLLWSKTYGGTNADNFNKIHQTADSGYIAVGTTRSYHQTTGEIFVVKTNASGTVVWSRGLARGTANGETGYDIIQTSDHGYALTGLWNYASGVDQFEVVKLDSNGNVIWGETFGSTSSDNLGGIVEKADTLFMGGFFYSSAVTKTVASGGGSPPYTYYDALLCKIDRSNGNIVWAKSYDIASKSNWVFNMTTTANGYRLNTFNADSYSNTNPKQLALDLDRSGTAIRAIQMTPATAVSISTTVSSPTFDGGYIFSQGYYDATFGDPFLHKVDAAGNVTWTNRIRRTGVQYLNQIFQNKDSSFAGGGGDGNRALLLKTSKWGKTFCSDTALNYPGTSLAIITYNLTFTTTSLTFSTPNITVTAGTPATVQTDICSTNPCSAPLGYGPTLCGRSAPVFSSVSLESIDNCTDSTIFAVTAGTELYNSYSDSINNNFDSSYRTLCMQAYKYESFTVTHKQSEYHYTLYYYDQAGNLVKTIPPAGVDLSKFGWLSLWSDSVTTARNNNLTKVPSHVLLTNYRYNSLNQVVKQKTPDGGTSQFWYDRLGRLSISQNLKQYSVSGSETGRQYSYTLYDYLGRITEVGQISNAGSTTMTDSISRRQSLLDSWLSSSVAGKEQITQTVYDLAYTSFPSQLITQRNLRNRVSYTSFAAGNNPANYDQSSFYTYDALGNVDTLLQDYGSSATNGNVMNANNNRWKKTVYQFDLISGKVNSVAFQPGQADQFYHRYSYDAENRIILAETSSDSITWEKDARYWYYKHGPLARVVIGDQLVQGVDYAYTLQGWLKGVNSTNLNPNNDMGRDGDTTYLNRYVAKDAFGFNLTYYAGDYTSIKTSVSPFPGYSGLIGTGYKPLWNGNISSMAVNIGQFNGPLLYMYTYDQLNRLAGMDVDSGFSKTTNTWNSTPTSIQDYKEGVVYDPNGNITNYLRNGTSTVNLTMDSLSYFYNRDVNGKLLNNQLNYIRDEIGGSTAHSSNYQNDIDNQSANNYGYDSIGNLTKDNAEGITNISWSVYGKILEIQRTVSGSNPTTDIQYSYDAAGNRIGKKVTDNSGNITYTWYARDAQGNVMSTYMSAGTGSTLTAYPINLSEQHLYGSSRLGILSRNLDVKSTYTPGTIITFQRGLKNYELSNHLGNVLVTISDKKTGVSTNGTTIDNFTADVRTATDYYPFGMQMPNRTYAVSSAYRYGFNGKEKNSEIKGDGNEYDFGERIYDARISKWLSSDPLFSEYPHQSPYASMSNDPINRIDPSGMGDYYGKDGKHLGSDGKTITQGEGKNAKQVSDDKAYTTSQAVIDQFTKNGNTDWDKVIANSGTSELNLSNSTLGKFANAIARESSGNKTESYALGSAIVNLANYKGKDILSTLKSQGIFGYNGNTDYSNSENSMGAALNAISGGPDYSNGAIRWDGFDLAARGFNHPKPRSQTGVEISDDHFNTFKSAWPDATIRAYSNGAYTSFSKNFSSGIHVATQGINVGRCLFKSTAVHGKTMFWGVNRDPIIIKTNYYPVVYNPSSFPGFLFNGQPLIEAVTTQIHVNSGFKGWKGL